MNKIKILITGTAGFIGYHLVSKLIEVDSYDIFGLDNINDYYDINLKFARLKEHGINGKEMNYHDIQISKLYPNYHFVKADLADYDFIVDFIYNNKFDYIVNLAAQAGVRYSIENPRAYTHSNIDGFLSILEGSRRVQVKHLIYASTSSVYGLNTKMPLSEEQSTDHPMSFYSATKKANELMAHNYSHLFKLPTTGLRFFTVYGPWGRPDMALFLFAKAMIKGEPIKVFNNGNMIRDFTYVGDIVESIYRLINKPAQSLANWDSDSPISSNSSAPYQIFNIGNSSPVKLIEYINALEDELNIEAMKEFLPMQPGDVPSTNANIQKLEEYINFRPRTEITIGIKEFVKWYKKYFKDEFQ
jgi:UDP-glucuronate 4-epimerase